MGTVRFIVILPTHYSEETIFYVTHDVYEAVMLGDYVYILSNKNNFTQLIFQTYIDNNTLENHQVKLTDILINN